MATLARPHSHLSHRAKVRSALERKPVFRSVLENPFQISWPSLPDNVQNTILARLVATLEEMISSRHHTSRKSLQKAAIFGEQDDIITEKDPRSSHPTQQISMGAPPQLIIGLNAVTRVLQSQLQVTRRRIVVNSRPDSHQLPLGPMPPPIAVVFACRADVDPSALVDHIPYLVAGCNSPRNATQLIKLVPLPKNSEPIISGILGVRRAAVIAFQCGSSFEAIRDILDSIPVISAPWLCPSDAQDAQLVPTHIKQLHTSAPKDMRSAREQRSKARAAARKKESSSSRAVRRKPRVTLSTG